MLEADSKTSHVFLAALSQPMRHLQSGGPRQVLPLCHLQLMLRHRPAAEPCVYRERHGESVCWVTNARPLMQHSGDLVGGMNICISNSCGNLSDRRPVWPVHTAVILILLSSESLRHRVRRPDFAQGKVSGNVAQLTCVYEFVAGFHSVCQLLICEASQHVVGLQLVVRGLGDSLLFHPSNTKAKDGSCTWQAAQAHTPAPFARVRTQEYFLGPNIRQ